VGGFDFARAPGAGWALTADVGRADRQQQHVLQPKLPNGLPATILPAISPLGLHSGGHMPRSKTSPRTWEVPSTSTSAQLFTLPAPGHYEVSSDYSIVVTHIEDTDVVFVVLNRSRAICRVRAEWPMVLRPIAENAFSIAPKLEVRQ
jgi:hypothetical protein